MKILLAVSGGIDSMYLANRRSELFPGAEFAAAHCNFGLRGDESDGDEEFVRGWCMQNGTECFTTRFDTASYASSRGISIEMAARELRYRWFAGLCKEKGYDAVAVAHNANDNAETLMLNLLRGSGTRGLRGMAEKTVIEGATVLRPMLETSREEILKWMKAGAKEWREDRTNSGNEYKRNKIRNVVFPVFKEINPSFLRTLGRDMEHFAKTDDIAEDYYMSLLPSIRRESADGGYPVFDLKAIMARKHWEYLLWRVLEPYHLSEETFAKLTALLSSGRTISGKKFESPTHVISIKRKLIIIEDR